MYMYNRNCFYDVRALKIVDISILYTSGLLEVVVVVMVMTYLVRI